jgi:AcrR family transcriptional regulator
MSEHTSITRARNAARAERRGAVAAVDHDPRATRTHEALAAALMALAATKPLQAMTVSELVDAAGVHRTTFYGHYADIFAFADKLGASALDDLAAAADAGADHVPRILTHILEQRPLYRLLFGPLDVGFSRALRDQAATIVSHRAENNVAAAFLAGGLAAVLEEWANSDSTDVAGYADGLTEAFVRVNAAR